MRASVLIAPETSEVQELPVPELLPDEVLIRVKTCGVCASELHRWEHGGTQGFPQRMGHEPAGIVEAVGPQVTRFQVGDRVAALAPGTGAFADNIAVTEDRVIPVAAGVTFDAALAEPLGCLVSGLERTTIHVADRVAIVGCGFMGLALLQLVKHRGASEIIAVDVREDALAMARQLGADRAYLPDSVEPSLVCRSADQLGQGVDVVFETTGTQAALTLAGDMTRAHGVLSIVGWHVGGLREINLGLWNFKATTIINAHERRMDHLVRYMEAGLQMVAAGKIDMDVLVTHAYRLDNVDQAFADMRSKPAGFVKAVIRP